MCILCVRIMFTFNAFVYSAPTIYGTIVWVTFVAAVSVWVLFSALGFVASTRRTTPAASTLAVSRLLSLISSRSQPLQCGHSLVKCFVPLFFPLSSSPHSRFHSPRYPGKTQRNCTIDCVDRIHTSMLSAWIQFSCAYMDEMFVCMCRVCYFVYT